ncbi:MAG TPA: hypothetical protein VJB96_05795 [Patescibacteria group bacterium]|nr:hypothetical protein [Patescibacteria group bacterium]
MIEKERVAGQVMITMLYIMVIGILVTTGATYAVIANTQSTTTYELGTRAHQAAESGIENALIRLIRDPAYAGETLVVAPGETATITVSTASGIVVTSSGTAGGTTRQIETTIQYNNGILTILSWKELP